MANLRPVGASVRRQGLARRAIVDAPLAESSRHVYAYRSFTSTQNVTDEPVSTPTTQTTVDHEAESARRLENMRENMRHRMMLQQERQRLRQAKAVEHARRWAQGLKQIAVDDDSTEPLPLPPTPRELTQSDEEGENRTPDLQVREILEKANETLDKWYDSKVVVRYVEAGTYKDKEANFYRKQYLQAQSRIGKALVKAQVKELLHGVKGLKNKSKDQLIVAVMEGLGWEAPVEPEEPELEMATVNMIWRELDLPEHELFLFLRDEKLLQRLMADQKLSLSVRTSTTEGKEGQQVLAVRGLPEHIDELSGIIAEKAQLINTQTVSPSSIHDFQPPPGLVKFVSDITGVHIGVVNGTDYLISSTDPVKAEAASRCLQVAALRSHLLPNSRDLTFIAPPPGPADEFAVAPNYTLSPYFPTPSLFVPWHSLVHSFAEPAHRLRRVGQWGVKPGRLELKHRDEAIENAKVFPIGTEAGSERSLREYVQGWGDTTAAAGTQTNTLTFGHVLLTNDANEPRKMMSPPVMGQWPAVESQNRLQGIRRIFTPCLTPSMIQRNLSNPPLRRRRLVYRSPDGKHSLVFTYHWPVEQQVPSAVAQLSVGEEEHENWLQKLDEILASEKTKKAARGTEKETPTEPAVEDGAAFDMFSDLKDAHVDKKDSEDIDQESPQEPGWKNMFTEMTEGLDAFGFGAKRQDPPATESASATPGARAQMKGAVVAERCVLNEVDMMLADRPVDARLTIRSSDVMASEDVPESIHGFFRAALPSLQDAESPKPTKSTKSTKSKKSAKSTKATETPETAESSEPAAPGPMAPMNLEVDGQSYMLEKDDEMQVIESAAGQGVTLKAVHARDMILGSNKLTSHSELEFVGQDIPSVFWRELASTTRDVPPSASSVGRSSYMI